MWSLFLFPHVFLLGHSLHWVLTRQVKQLYFIIVRMNNPNRKLKGTDERYSHDEKTLKNCLSQNGNSLGGFLGRLHLSELGRKKKGSHSLVANSAGNQLSHRLGWLSYSASGFPIQIVRKKHRKLMGQSLTLCDSREYFWGPTVCDFKPIQEAGFSSEELQNRALFENKRLDLVPNKYMRFGEKI